MTRNDLKLKLVSPEIGLPDATANVLIAIVDALVQLGIYDFKTVRRTWKLLVDCDDETTERIECIVDEYASEQHSEE